jgi:hypothetical protein
LNKVISISLFRPVSMTVYFDPCDIPCNDFKLTLT